MAPIPVNLIEPTSLWTDADRAWMAGFYEGEGNVSTQTGSNGRKYYKLALPQVNPEPLARVHSLCGGSVHIRPRKAPHKACLIWQVSGERARQVAREIEPLLSTKRRRELASVLAWTPAPPKTHCKRGHEFTAENTYRYPNSNRRQCRTCMRTVYR